MWKLLYEVYVTKHPICTIIYWTMAHLSANVEVEVDRNSGPRHWPLSGGFTVLNRVAVCVFFVIQVVDAILPATANQPTLYCKV